MQWTGAAHTGRHQGIDLHMEQPVVLNSRAVTVNKQQTGPGHESKQRDEQHTLHLDELYHVRLIVRAHQGSGQESRQQHAPFGRQGIYPSSIWCSQCIGAVESQEGWEEGRKFHRVAVQSHDDALQHAHSGLVGCLDAQLVFAAWAEAK